MNTFIIMSFLGLLGLGFQSFAQDTKKIEKSPEQSLEARLASIENSLSELDKKQGSQAALFEAQAKKHGCQIGQLNQFHPAGRTFIGSNAIITTTIDIETGNEVIKHIAQKQQLNPLAKALSTDQSKQEVQKLFDDHQKSIKKSQEINKSLSKEKLDENSLERYKKYELQKQKITKQQIDLNQVDV